MAMKRNLVPQGKSGYEFATAADTIIGLWGAIARDTIFTIVYQIAEFRFFWSNVMRFWAVFGLVSAILVAAETSAEGANDRLTFCWVDDFTTTPKTTYYSYVFQLPDNASVSSVETAFEDHLRTTYDKNGSFIASCEFSLTGSDLESVQRAMKSRMDTQRMIGTRVVSTVWQYSGD